MEKVKTGTTTVGMVCSDGVILGSEKRATMGMMVANREIDKVLMIQPHIGMTIAGAVGDAQALVRIMRIETSLYEIQRGRNIPVEGASTLLSNILQNTKYYPYYVQVLIGGLDTEPHIFSLDPDGSMLVEKYVVTGSGTPFAYGVLEDNFKEGKAIRDNLPLAARAISVAMKRDTASGEGINLAVIDKKGFRKLTDQEILKLSQ
ncbi:archaeal proteasome endopeptidase complex subunit beta [Candidatus Micrarchaeota archaeon]|nr:archaeal proteasome endopeptidase complex subunit beta [Candidatus Micrarchaeota archaeon]